MGVTEQQRHQLFVWFEEQMGEERASTMMELMPASGERAATKADLEKLRSDLQRTLGTWIFASQAAVIAAIGVFTALG